jgi:hypothetical protein
MPKHTLYAYVDGADLEDVATQLEARFTEFVASRQWIAGVASVINQRHGRDTCTQPGDLPLWDLGLTLQLPDPGTELSLLFRMFATSCGFFIWIQHR